MASGFSNIIWKEDEKEEENCNFLLHQLVFFLDFFSQRFLAKAVVVLVAALERQLTAIFFFIFAQERNDEEEEGTSKFFQDAENWQS